MECIATQGEPRVYTGCKFVSGVAYWPVVYFVCAAACWAARRLFALCSLMTLLHA